MVLAIAPGDLSRREKWNYYIGFEEQLFESPPHSSSIVHSRKEGHTLSDHSELDIVS